MCSPDLFSGQAAPAAPAPSFPADPRHANRVAAVQEEEARARRQAQYNALEREMQTVDRSLGRFGLPPGSGYQAAAGHIIATPGDGGPAFFAAPAPAHVDMQHEARRRALGERRRAEYLEARAAAPTAP